MTRRSRQPPIPEPGRHEHDARLVARCLEGDEKAWTELLQRHRPLVLAIGHRNGLRGDLAEDLYQATCVTLLQRLELLRDHQSLAAWVATTAARKAWRIRRRASQDTPLGAERPSSAPSPHEEFAAAAESSAVSQALGSMGEPCQSLLRALFVEDRPYEDVAARLGLAVGSVGVYRRRCLEKLRRELEANGWSQQGGDGHD